LCHGALEKIHQIIQNSSKEISVFAWQHLMFDSKTGLLRATSRASNAVKVFLSRKLLKEYENTHGEDYRFPVGVNSCYREDLAAKIRRKHGRLFSPISPDVFSSFMLLSYVDRIVGVNESLFLTQTAANSNGAATMRIGPEYYLDTLNLSSYYRHVPIKAPFSSNLGFEDFLTVREMVGDQSLVADINWANYFLKCYEEYIYFGISGFIKNRKTEFLKEWKRALDSFDKETQAIVRKKAKWIKIHFTIKSFLAKSPFMPLLRKVQNRVQFSYWSNKSYASALEAAGFKKINKK
jgi:hypothetical protein